MSSYSHSKFKNDDITFHNCCMYCAVVILCSTFNFLMPSIFNIHYRYPEHVLAIDLSSVSYCLFEF